MRACIDPSGSRPAQTPPAQGFERVVSLIQAWVQSGELKPGDRLPSERDLAKHLGVSGKQVREALMRLEQAGEVRLDAGRNAAAFILPVADNPVARVLSGMFADGMLSLPDLVEARLMVHESVIRLACERGTDADFDAIERAIDETDEVTRAGRLHDRARSHIEFYRRLAQSGHNEVLVLLTVAMAEVMRKFRAMAISRGLVGVIEPISDSRRRLCGRLRARDPEGAAHEMHAMLRELYRSFEEGIGADQVRSDEFRVSISVGALMAGETPAAPSSTRVPS